MNRSLSLLSMSALLGLMSLSLPVLAQEPPTPTPAPVPAPAPASPVTPAAAPTQPPTAPAVPDNPVAPAAPSARTRVQPPRNSVRGNTLIIMGDYFSGMLSETLQQKIEFDAKDMPALDALKVIMEQVKVPYEISPEATSDVKITMTLKGVPAVYALMLITREAKLSFAFESKDGKERVHIIKMVKQSGNRISVNVPEIATTVSPQVAARIANNYTSSFSTNGYTTYATGNGGRAGTVYTPGQEYRATGVIRMPAVLPDVRVKLDARNIEVRDALKKVLEQAKLAFVMDDDVPEKLKRSFTFENVPIATALDVICRSADIGWFPEMRPDSSPVIHIGKKYSPVYRIIGPSAGAPGPGAAAGPGQSPFMTPPVPFGMPPMERRAIFTCPYCKSQHTVVLKEDSERNKARGQSQSQTRSEESKQWKFCPSCGKKVDIRVNLAPLPEDEHTHDVLIQVTR